MKKVHLLMALGILAALVFGTTSGIAATIPIYSTGIGNYTVSGPGISGSIPAVTATSLPYQWVNPTGASWIAPSADQSFNRTYVPGTGSLPGDYTYTTTFSLSALNPDTAILAGGWSTDNGGSMFLNGVQVAIVGPTLYGSLTDFVIDSGFVAGLNTLTFVVNNEYGIGDWAGDNGENPTGLVVKFTQAEAAVPEPSFILLLGLALGAITLLKQHWRS